MTAAPYYVIEHTRLGFYVGHGYTGVAGKWCPRWRWSITAKDPNVVTWRTEEEAAHALRTGKDFPLDSYVRKVDE